MKKVSSFLLLSLVTFVQSMHSMELNNEEADNSEDNSRTVLIYDGATCFSPALCLESIRLITQKNMFAAFSQKHQNSKYYVGLWSTQSGTEIKTLNSTNRVLSSMYPSSDGTELAIATVSEDYFTDSSDSTKIKI